MGNFSCVIDIKVKVKRAGICDGVTSTAVWLSSLLQGLSDTYVYMVTIKNSTGFHALRLPHWHSIHFDVFSSIKTKLSMVIENAIDYSFSCNSLFMDARGSENAKCYILEIPLKIQVYFSLISEDQKPEMCSRNTFSSFQYSIWN